MLKDAMKKPHRLTCGASFSRFYRDVLARAVEVLEEFTIGREDQASIAIGH